MTSKTDCTMHIHLILREADDAAIIAWLQALPKGRRTEEIRRILRWYLVPGGFLDVLNALRDGPGGQDHAPSPVQTSPDSAQAHFQSQLQSVLTQMGWQDS